MELVGTAGLTIAVLDALVKLGKGTEELISNYRKFDSDSMNVGYRVRDESNRTRALRMLLLEPSSTYGGKSLFEQFDIDVQNQIHNSLEQACDVLGQAHQLLRRRQGTQKDLEPDLLTTASLAYDYSSGSLVPSPAVIPISTKRPGSFQRIRWSLLDKKRVEAIVGEFSGLNSRIHESIKLWCLGTSIGVDLRHLRHLENDPHSQALGFDVDARLQIATRNSQEKSEELEISESAIRESLSDIQMIGDKFGVIHHDGKASLLEFRLYNPEAPVTVQLDDRTRELVNRLANLLHQPKEIIFRTPDCVGWFQKTVGNKIAYIFNIPEGFRPSPVSLLDVLRSKQMTPPSLGQKFQMALQLSRSISQLQLVKWVHESIRSENILFLPRDDETDPDEPQDISEPWLFGFEFSRPEMFFSHGHADPCLERDLYRHPERQQRPTQMFGKIHDIYALGVVLLEIGLWQPVISLEKYGFSRAQSPESIKLHLIHGAEKKLGAKMGTKYMEVVIKCLASDFGVEYDNKQDLKLQQEFRSDVVDVLERAASCI